MSVEIDEDELISRSRAGDREAFGAIVRRYQGLVCAITYSGTGDVAVSEEIAQETFLNAWRSLGQVRDPGRFRQWLCQIARNAVRGWHRRRGRDVLAQAGSISGATEVAAAESADHVRQMEEQAVVRAALERMPEEYREPLVLFYRQGQSVRQVAEGLGISEDAARQRLSRGRKMLKAEVAAAVERTLARTGPGDMFGAMVLAAIASTGVVTATASAATVTAEGAAAAKSAAAGVLGGVLGILGGLAGAIIGTRASIVNTKSDRERRFVIWSCVLMGATGLLLVCVPLVLMLARLSPQWVFWTSVCAFYVVLVPLIVWGNRRQRQIRVEDGTLEEPQRVPATFSRAAVFGSFGGGIFGPVAWIVPVSAEAGKWWIGAAAVAAAGVVFWLSVRACTRVRRISLKVTAWAIAAVGAIDLAAFNLFWEDVIWRQLAEQGVARGHEGLARVALSVAIGAAAGAMAVGCALMERRRGRAGQQRIDGNS